MRRAASARARIVLSTFAVLLLAAGTASAEKKRVGIPRFDGPQEAVVRKAVMQVLKGEGYDIVGSREIEAAARGAGAQLDSNDGYRSVARELSISSFVTGEVAKKKAKLTVRNGADGSVSGEGSFAGANPAKVAAEVRDGFARRLGSAVERGRAPSGAKKPTAAPAPVAEESEESGGGGDEGAAEAKAPPPSRKREAEASNETKASDESSESKASSSGSADDVVARKAPEPEETGAAGPRALDVSAGLRAFSRSLTYNQDVFNALREYKLTLGPAVAVNALAYPAAFASGGFAANIGVEVSLEQAFGVASKVPAGQSFPMGATFPTVIHDFGGALHIRLPFDANEVSFFAGGGEHAFSFRSSGGANRGNLDIPDTIYRYLRVGADARFVLSSGLTLGLSGAYRHVLNQGGQIALQPTYDMNNNLVSQGFFPYLTVRGVDLGARLGYQVTPSIEARFAVDLRRYGFDMHSAKADIGVNKVAGGAVDQYLAFTLGVAYVFGGVSPGASVAEPEAEAAPAAAEEAPKKKSKKKKAEESDGDDDEE